MEQAGPTRGRSAADGALPQPFLPPPLLR